MDSKNVILAVILSTIVLIFWATFFEPPIVEQEINKSETSKKENDSTPSIEKATENNKISRAEALNSTNLIVQSIFVHIKSVISGSLEYDSNNIINVCFLQLGHSGCLAINVFSWILGSDNVYCVVL